MPAATCRPAQISRSMSPVRGRCPGRVRVPDRNHPHWLRIAVDPDSVYDYHLTTRELTLLKRTPVLDDPRFGSYQPDNYVQERGWATAPDGTECRCRSCGRRTFRSTARHRRCSTGTGRMRHRWTRLLGLCLSLLDRGIVYAIAHIRGGGELGRTWYEQGKKLAKKNTFTDFIACADYLVEQGYTSPDRLAARGSAGGLLMGAVANLAPGGSVPSMRRCRSSTPSPRSES